MELVRHIAALAGDRPATSTDILVQLDGVDYRVEDDCLLVRLPGRPDYYSGNLVVALDQEPETTAEMSRMLVRWLALWERGLGPQYQRGHVRVQWETTGPGTPARTEALREAVAAAGGSGGWTLELDHNVVLELAEGTAPPPLPGVIVRPLDTEREWDELVAVALAENPGNEPFVTWQREQFRQMSARGRGQWWGAWLDGRLAGCAGVFTGHGLARFQEVLTHPELRRRGVCANLCHAISENVRARAPGARVIIVAEPGSAAARIYGRLGFRPVGQQWMIQGGRS